MLHIITSCKANPIKVEVKQQEVKAYGTLRLWIPVFLTSVLDENKLRASRSCRFNPGGMSPE